VGVVWYVGRNGSRLRVVFAVVVPEPVIVRLGVVGVAPPCVVVHLNAVSTGVLALGDSGSVYIYKCIRTERHPATVPFVFFPLCVFSFP
jgi:hypothetical protein